MQGSYYVFIAWRGWYRAYRVGSSGNDNSVTCEHYPYLAAFSLLLLDFVSPHILNTNKCDIPCSAPVAGVCHPDDVPGPVSLLLRPAAA